ncbi:dephospho-CoA kinase [Micromonospora sp. CPCC 206060]|uniref:dephospho-CoA kinase n=1 Tax=Micromonospora sp. CPCC 206060 TaxID=3122406 RepID=UPI002FEF0411
MGLTGGIGSGKSVVASRLAGLGAVVIDSDRLAREVVAPGTEGLAEIVAAFGSSVVAPDGSLDRPALGALVFGDEAARRRLERIVHPRVRARTVQLTGAAPADAVVVNDVPLLVEVGLAPTYHLVLVVEATESTRIGRLVRDRGMGTTEAVQRIRAQADDIRRRAAADVVLGNDAGLAELHDTVDHLWRDRLVPYEHNLRTRRPVPGLPLTGGAGDPTWPAQYARLAARLRHTLGPVAEGLSHVGPTAQGRLPEQDIIDMRLTVASVAQATAMAEPLAGAGFPAWPEPADHPRSPGGWRYGSADPGRPVDLRVLVRT